MTDRLLDEIIQHIQLYNLTIGRIRLESDFIMQLLGFGGKCDFIPVTIIIIELGNGFTWTVTAKTEIQLSFNGH